MVWTIFPGDAGIEASKRNMKRAQMFSITCNLCESPKHVFPALLQPGYSLHRCHLPAH